MSTFTIGEAIGLTGVSVLEHLDRQVEIPVITGLQAQGDVIIIPAKEGTAVTPVPQQGVPVVRGESGGNTHLLLCETGSVLFDRATQSREQLDLGVLTVGDDSVALFAHPEHGFSRVGPGSYLLRRQRQRLNEIILVAD